MVSVRVLHELLAPVVHRVKLMLLRGVVRGSTQKGLQLLQIETLAGVQDDVEHFEPLGLTARPIGTTTELLSGYIGGSRMHPVVLAVVDRTKRPQDLEEGEVLVYQPATGARIHLKANGDIELTPAASGDVRVTGDLLVAGGIQATGNINTTGGELNDPNGSLQALRDLFNLHTHRENGAGGGITDPPTPQAPT